MMYFKYKHSVSIVIKTKIIKSYELSEIVRQNIVLTDPSPVH